MLHILENEKKAKNKNQVERRGSERLPTGDVAFAWLYRRNPQRIDPVWAKLDRGLSIHEPAGRIGNEGWPLPHCLTVILDASC